MSLKRKRHGDRSAPSSGPEWRRRALTWRPCVVGMYTRSISSGRRIGRPLAGSIVTQRPTASIAAPAAPRSRAVPPWPIPVTVVRRSAQSLPLPLAQVRSNTCSPKRGKCSTWMRGRRLGCERLGNDRVDEAADRALGEARVDARLAGLRAAVAEARRGDEAQLPAALGDHQRTARVALAGVGAALRVAGAEHRLR